MQYRNPVFSDYFADPFVFRHGEFYYANRTTPTTTAVDGRLFPLLRSRDLVHWEFLQNALVPPATELGDTYWAPEIAYKGGRFYLYYSVGFEDKRHQIRVALSEAPQGPYRDFGKTLVGAPDCAFAIDAHPFCDEDGQWYLFYACDFLDCASEIRAGTALKVRRLKTMTELEAGGAVVLRARYDWQRFEANRAMYGGRYDWHTLEVPSVLKHDGKYYCFYSGGRWENDSYGVDYAVSENIFGPYESVCPTGPRVLCSVPNQLLGPGHNSFVMGPDGKKCFIVYHAWDKQMTERRLCLDPLIWTEDGPRSPGPTFTPQTI